MADSEAPAISVIIPVYNREDQIGDAIESVFEQSFRDLELIVVDDGSRDNSVDVVRSYDDDRLRLLEHDINQNGSAARNTGIDAARGEFVAFLDSDDRWMPHKLEVIHQRIESLRERGKLSDKTAIFSALEMQTPQSTVRLPVRPPKGDETIREYISMGHGLIHMITLVTTRTLAASVRFDEQLPVGQDADFAMRLDATGADFYYIDEVLAVWQRMGDDHVSGSNKYQAGLQWLERNPDLLTARQKARYLGAVLSRRAIRAGEKGLALQWILGGLASGVLQPREVAELLTALALPPELDQRLWNGLRRLYHSVGA